MRPAIRSNRAIKLRHALLLLLLLGAATVWMPERTAANALQSAACLLAAGSIARRLYRRQPVVFAFPDLLLLAVACWAAAQMLFRWTVLQTETRDALLYWIAAVAFAWLGHEACREPAGRHAFLKAATMAGAGLCLIGIVQVYTSHGKVFWIFPTGYDSGVIGPFVSANNFAAFVELLLPVALILALEQRRRYGAWLLTAGFLLAAAFVGGSRAGAALSLTSVAFMLTLGRRTGPTENVPWRGLKFLLSATACTLILGYRPVWDRLLHMHDPYAFRREFLISSLSMVQRQPLHGFGFGTWPSVYPMFAIFDAGAFVNHSHNEWVQWAAEGGLVAFGLMSLLFAWCCKRALRSTWAIGVLAVFLHSLVDYPFLRLGLAAWTFVWIGALASSRSRRLEAAPESPARQAILRAVFGAAFAIVFVISALFSGRIGYAETLYRIGRPEQIAQAVRLSPNRADYRLAMAAADPDHAASHWTAAIALNPYLIQARIGLAGEREQQGDLAGSEYMLLQAARLDHQFAPAWALANFYFRIRRPDMFWNWASRAAALSPSQLAPLFDLCFLETDRPEVVEQQLAALHPAVERSLLQYLIATKRTAAAGPVAVHLARAALPPDRDGLLDYIDTALATQKGEDAAAAWNEMCHSGLLRFCPVEAGAVVNGDFRRPLLNRGFDWRLSPAGGIFVTQPPGQVEFTFSGREPERCELLGQWIALHRNRDYILQFQYRTAGLPSQTGLFWSMDGQQGEPLPATAAWNTGLWHLRSTAAMSRLWLSYGRLPGQVRIEGSFRLREVRLEAL